MTGIGSREPVQYWVAKTLQYEVARTLPSNCCAGIKDQNNNNFRGRGRLKEGRRQKRLNLTTLSLPTQNCQDEHEWSEGPELEGLRWWGATRIWPKGTWKGTYKYFIKYVVFHFCHATSGDFQRRVLKNWRYFFVFGFYHMRPLF